MSFSRKAWILVIGALLLTTACNRAAVQNPSPLETQETASPTPSPTPTGFELEGVVLEASGSAQGGATSSASPATGATQRGTASASASPEETQSPEATGQAAGGAQLFQNASPGSIALRLNSFNSTGPCSFNANDTVVVSFTASTTFEPSDVTDSERFPNNLVKGTLQVRGDVLEPDQGCILVARSITVSQQASQSPSARATSRATSRAATRRSPTPRATTGPSARASVSPSATAGGSPGTAGSPGA